MKRLIFIYLLILLGVFLHAQAPHKLSYQAVIRNGSGALLTNSNVGIRIQIQNSEFGAAVYVETHTATTNGNGLVTIEIGSGMVVTGTFANIDWSVGPYFLKTETDPSGGTNYTIEGISQILSVPYALYAKTAGNGFSGNYEDLENKPDFIDWDDNVSDDFSGSYPDLSNKPLIPSINDPSISTTSIWSSTKTNTELGYKADKTDVFTKTNLQTSGQSIVHYSNLSNKPLNLDEDKTDDVTISGNQTITGNKTFKGVINASNKAIVNVADPLNNQDAATKAYVDKLEARLVNVESYVNKHGTVTDIEGNTYKTIKIGDQVWMAENLRAKKLNDGTLISSYTFPNFGSKYIGDSSAFEEYGLIYEWPIDNLCPVGWHIPIVADWQQLEALLGMNVNISDVPENFEAVGGDKLKINGVTEFNAIFAGYALEYHTVDAERTYNGFGTQAYFWSKPGTSDMMPAIILSIGSSTYTRALLGYYRTSRWLSIRCIKD